MIVYASPADFGALSRRIEPKDTNPSWERNLGPISNIAPGLHWQSGALSIPLHTNSVLVVSGAPRCLSNLALLLRARLLGIPTLWWGHYWSSTSKWWRTGLRLALMRLASGVIFYTDSEASEYFATRPTGKTKGIFALNNGIDTKEIRNLRQSYRAQRRGNKLFFIGRLTTKAQLSLLLEAMTTPELAGVVLEVIGDGDQKERLRAQAETSGLVSRVIWHDGTTDEAKIAEVANRCTLFVYPGAVGLSLIHGLAYGLPAIVHHDRWRHMPEIAALRPGANGQTFKAENVHSLSATIATHLDDKQKLDAMSKAAIKTVDEDFNVETMVERFLQAVNAIRE